MVTTIDVDFMAPEVMQGMAVSYATDIWSVGVIAFVMLMRHLPFSPTNDTHTLANTSENPVTLAMAFADRLRQRMSPQALDFIRRCTILWVPSDRLTVEQCLAHPWLADAPDPLWMLRTLADVCATASPASANQPRSSPEQERRPVAALDLRMRAATGERDRVRPRPLQHDAEPITPTDQMSVARDTASTRTSTSSTF
ncbi:calcium/calmodulin-dependent protein kinase type 1-like [Anopheles cruzii]|uniref:calcium/calmodulin-dependent protein kinase type 1-like n=1 Tax=Anopheles cruzii TaxID=68878 RepID=UPI0022EC7C02|nr:calcium/calmodulin-dependent protein kinase type 1-like [Anopheles cruzii]